MKLSLDEITSDEWGEVVEQTDDNQTQNLRKKRQADMDGDYFEP